MAQAIVWSREALEDIEAIAEHISRDSVYHATQVVERLLDLGESIPEHPKIGRVVPELNNPEVRERFLYSYRLIYELIGDTIHILAVIHGKRLLESVERFNR